MADFLFRISTDGLEHEPSCVCLTKATAQLLSQYESALLEGARPTLSDFMTWIEQRYSSSPSTVHQKSSADEWPELGLSTDPFITAVTAFFREEYAKAVAEIPRERETVIWLLRLADNGNAVPDIYPCNLDGNFSSYADLQVTNGLILVIARELNRPGLFGSGSYNYGYYGSGVDYNLIIVAARVCKIILDFCVKRRLISLAEDN